MPGGCSGSTAGGMKIDRMAIIAATIRSTFLKQQHPQAVIPIHIRKLHIDEVVAKSATVHLVLLLLILVLATGYFTFTVDSSATGFATSLSMVSNVGPSIGSMSFFGSYSFLGDIGRLFASILMLLGRLEIFGLLLIFFPSSWK